MEVTVLNLTEAIVEMRREDVLQEVEIGTHSEILEANGAPRIAELRIEN